MPNDLLTDIQLAWRGLLRSRGFTGAAVVVLGVGIAGATAILALLHGDSCARCRFATSDA
jgi:hypothetical protein